MTEMLAIKSQSGTFVETIALFTPEQAVEANRVLGLYQSINHDPQMVYLETMPLNTMVGAQVAICLEIATVSAPRRRDLHMISVVPDNILLVLCRHYPEVVTTPPPVKPLAPYKQGVEQYTVEGFDDDAVKAAFLALVPERYGLQRIVMPTYYTFELKERWREPV